MYYGIMTMIKRPRISSGESQQRSSALRRLVGKPATHLWHWYTVLRRGEDSLLDLS